MCFRTVYKADMVDGKLQPINMLVVRFGETEATVSVIAAKVKEALGSDEEFVLTDIKGTQIVDSEGTTGNNPNVFER